MQLHIQFAPTYTVFHASWNSFGPPPSFCLLAFQLFRKKIWFLVLLTCHVFWYVSAYFVFQLQKPQKISGAFGAKLKYKKYMKLWHVSAFFSFFAPKPQKFLVPSARNWNTNTYTWNFDVFQAFFFFFSSATKTPKNLWRLRREPETRFFGCFELKHKFYLLDTIFAMFQLFVIFL